MKAKGIKATLAAIALGVSGIGLTAPAIAEPMALLDRHGSRVAIEPYAPNIVLDKSLAEAAPGPGPIAASNAAGWTHSSEGGADIFRSSALTLTVDAQPWPKAPTQMERYFAPSLPPVSLSVSNAQGKLLTKMTGWEMAPHSVNGASTRRRTNIIMAWARTRKACSTSKGERSTANIIMTRLRAKPFACPSW